jgi:hypothetical protein
MQDAVSFWRAASVATLIVEGDAVLLSVVEQKRLHLSKSTEANKKSLFGQFL